MSTIGIIVNGVTGRMGANQHLKRSIVAIRDEGGVDVAETGVDRYTTNLAEALADEAAPIYFDAQVTDVRYDRVWNLLEGAKGVQLAELGYRAARERTRLAVPNLA